MRAQTKSKERISRYGEVFTADREVNAMLDLVKTEAASIDSTFLEPACGDGNFLDEILYRKLTTAFSIAGNNDTEFEFLATRAFSSVYGIDIMEDNVSEARDRLYNGFFTRYVNQYRHRPTPHCEASIHFILSQNIQRGDTLQMTGTDNEPLLITKWAFDDEGGLVISIFKYADMVSSGSECAPIHIFPRIPYQLLPAIIRQ